MGWEWGQVVMLDYVFGDEEPPSSASMDCPLLPWGGLAETPYNAILPLSCSQPLSPTSQRGLV